MPAVARVAVLAICFLILTGCDREAFQPTGGNGSQASDDRRPLADSIRHSLEADLLDPWYMRAVDSVYGGYLSDFAYDWEERPPQDKFIVTQARHVWTLSRAAEFLPERRETYLAAAAHGVDFLRETMWDDEGGGFVSLITQQGALKAAGGSFTQGKTAYGNAFAIYGLAAYADVTGDTAALRLSQRTFRWLEEHMHDREQGGYFQFVDRDDEALLDGLDGSPPKDQNSSIHLLEAFTELYQIWPDSVLRDRLAEMLLLVRDTMVADDGYLRLFFERDWTPISHHDSSDVFIREHIELDHVSFGHDVETAYLMLEAAHALGIDTAPTLEVSKRMVDHALEHGWDEEVGGFFNGGYYFASADSPEVVIDSKAWWAQAEGLNSLLLLSDLYPNGEHRYYERFRTMWEYIQEYLIDHEHGGWYLGGIDRRPDLRTSPKGSIWKAAYHDGRALMNVARALERPRGNVSGAGD